MAIDETEKPEETNSWESEERAALVPVLGKLAVKSLPRTDFHEEKIRFGPHAQQYLMLFRPNEAYQERHTAIFFLHGGGWHSGSPALYHFAGHYFAGLGFPTILGGYRLAPAFTYPAQLYDVWDGLQAGLDALTAHGAQVERVIAGGISAGAHLAALLVYDRGQGGRSAPAPRLFSGFFSISGPLDFSACSSDDIQKMIADFIGEPANRDAADPIRVLHGDETVPALFIHGKRDPLVDVQNTLSFAARLKQSQTCPVEVHLVEGGHHADLAALFVDDLPVNQAFERWLNRCDRP